MLASTASVELKPIRAATARIAASVAPAAVKSMRSDPPAAPVSPATVAPIRTPFRKMSVTAPFGAVVTGPEATTDSASPARAPAV